MNHQRFVTTGHPAVLRAHEQATLKAFAEHYASCQSCRFFKDSRTMKELCPQGAAAFEEWHIAVSRLTLNGDHT